MRAVSASLFPPKYLSLFPLTHTTSLLTLTTLLLWSSSSIAEGSWQFGLFEGVSHAQPLFEYDSSISSTQTGIQALNRPLYVDVLSASETINVNACGSTDADAVRIEIWNESGSTQLSTFSHSAGTVSCADDFTGNLAPGFSYTPGAAATYQVRLFNESQNDSAGIFRRFDVSVTEGVPASVDPSQDQGRLFAYRWAFRCADGDTVCYQESRSTSADLYAVVDGGFADSFYVWQLDLTDFAGFAYEITANSIGLDSPNADGDVVAGVSACIDAGSTAPCPSVSGTRNTLSAIYRIYTSDPEERYPRPTSLPEISNLRFIDDEGVDNTISPGNTITVQDTGNFTFETNLVTQGTYTITIDVDGDGVLDEDDVNLNGIVTPGANSVNWDGRDNLGNPVADGTYTAIVQIQIGRFHFTGTDVETSGGAAGVGLTINAVLDSGVVDTSNAVYWDDVSALGLTGPTAFNLDGGERIHTWGTFTSGGDGNRAFIDTFVVGAASEPIETQVETGPSDAPQSAVTGLVFADLNGNGVQDAGEPGIANAVVNVAEDGGSLLSATTDSGGAFATFTDASSVTIDVDETTIAPGYTLTTDNEPQVVVIGPDPAVSNHADAIGYQLQLASISGQVRFDDDGDGDLADADTAQVGTPVTLYSDPNGDGDPSDGVLIASASTDTAGNFVFSDVPPGLYVVLNPPRDIGGINTAAESIAVIRAGTTDNTALEFLEASFPAPVVSIANAGSVSEGSDLVFTVTLDAPLGAPVMVPFMSVDGTAIAGSDYSAVAGVAIFSPGQTEVTLTVPTATDLLVEVPEDFTVVITKPDNAALGTDTGLGVILDTTASTPPQISIGDVVVAEGGTATVTVTLNKPWSVDVTADYSFADATAVVGTDYTAVTGSIKIPAGSTTASITVNAATDSTADDGERYLVSLSNVLGATVADGIGEVTITDVRPLSPAPIPVLPGAGLLLLIVSGGWMGLMALRRRQPH